MIRRIACIWAVPLGLALTLSSCRSPATGPAPAPEASAPSPPAPETEAGPPAPAFAAETVEGKKLALADYRGKSAVLLNFYSNT